MTWVLGSSVPFGYANVSFETFAREHAQGEVGKPGGMALNTARTIVSFLRTQPVQGVSDFLHLGIVTPLGLMIQAVYVMVAGAAGR